MAEDFSFARLEDLGVALWMEVKDYSSGIPAGDGISFDVIQPEASMFYRLELYPIPLPE